jgi:hypothetical protein
MNRLVDYGTVPNLSPIVIFVGGPFDGLRMRWSDGPCPDFIDVQGKHNNEPHKYQLSVQTDNKNHTRVRYKHCKEKA